MTEHHTLRTDQSVARRAMLALALVVTLVVGLVVGSTVGPTSVAAQVTGSTVPSTAGSSTAVSSTTGPPTTAPPDFIPADSSPSIIPNPNSGVAPAADGDRGSSSQYVVFALMIGGLATIVLLIRRESRRKRPVT